MSEPAPNIGSIRIAVSRGSDLEQTVANQTATAAEKGESIGEGLQFIKQSVESGVDASTASQVVTTIESASQQSAEMVGNVQSADAKAALAGNIFSVLAETGNQHGKKVLEETAAQPTNFSELGRVALQAEKLIADAWGEVRAWQLSNATLEAAITAVSRTVELAGVESGRAALIVDEATSYLVTSA